MEEGNGSRETLTLKTRVTQRFAAETFVILHSVDDDRPSKYVCEDKNVGLLQAGPGLLEENKKTTTQHTVVVLLNVERVTRTGFSCSAAVRRLQGTLGYTSSTRESDDRRMGVSRSACSSA